MIRKGDVIENPVTGERLLFLETSRETGGEYVLVECTVQPSGFVAAAHSHPYQSERFEIESGTVAFKLDGKEIVAGPGETVVVPAGSPHKFWNAGETEAVFVTEVRPALQFERLLETMFALANDGKTNRKGLDREQVAKVTTRSRPCRRGNWLWRAPTWPATSRR